MSLVITGPELKSQRTLRGMSQTQVADLLDPPVNQKTIANWEAGAGVPGSRETEIREKVFFSDTESMLDEVSTMQLVGALIRRLNRVETALARAEAELATTRAEDQWVGASPTRRTRRRSDTPNTEA